MGLEPEAQVTAGAEVVSEIVSRGWDDLDARGPHPGGRPHPGCKVRSSPLSRFRERGDRGEVFASLVAGEVVIGDGEDAGGAGQGGACYEREYSTLPTGHRFFQWNTNNA